MSAALSSILREIQPGLLAFWCPGCDDQHHVRVSREDGGSCWGYNGNAEKPTFSPSILVRAGHYVPGWDAATCYCQPDENGEDWGFKCYQCHSFVNDGYIQFLADSTHHLAGQTVAIPVWPA